MSRRPQDTVHVDVVETERRSAKSSRCVGATTESGSRPDVLSPAHGGACDVVDDGLPPTPMNEKKEKRRGIQAAGGSSSSSTMTRTNRKCSRRRRRCSSLGHHVEDVTFGADSRHYDANLASRVNRGLDSGLESDHDHDHGSPSFGSVVHHPFGLPLAWFLNKDLRASGNDDEDGDDDDDTGDRKPAVAQGGGGEGTANQDWATGGGAGAAAAEEDTTTSEATSKVVLNRKVEAMDLPCLLTASTSSTSDSDIVLLRGIESSSSDDENASATGDVAGTLTEVSSRTDFEPVTRGGDDQVEICRRRDKTNGSTAVSPPLSPSVFASATACGGAEEVGGIPPAGDEEAKAISKASPTIKTMFPSIVAKLEELAAGMPPSSVVDAVLQESYDAWLALGLKWTDHRKDENNRQPKPGEPRLTKLLCDGMKECMSRPDLEVIHQEGLKPEDGAVVSTGHPDVLVCAKSRYDSAAHACLMVEVGFGDTHHARWKKVHQLRQYEHMLRCGTNRVRLTSKPMLLSTLTIKRVGDDSFEFESGSLAVFLVTPKNEDGRHGSRVCLLTRTTTESLQVLSAALGQVLRAALALPLLDDDLVDFEYLGPNACRIGDKVLRSYDTRFRPSQRRFDVYLAPGIVEFAEILCKFTDQQAASLTVESAERCRPDAWLWKEWGSLVVVVTTYHKGWHWTESFAECIAIVRALEKLHKAGFVHGVIRAFNIVFGAGVLIDFDFGGKVDSKEGNPKVPRGYQRDLPDGSRVGKAGTPISMYHDWYALIQVLTAIHEISHLERYVSDFSKLKAKLMQLEEGERTTSIEDLTKEGGAVEGVAAAAVEFLTKAEASGCTIAPRQSFKEKLQSIGLYPETVNVNRNASSTATGSPDKRT